MARDNAGIKEVVSTIAYRMMTKGKTARLRIPMLCLVTGWAANRHRPKGGVA